MALGGMGGGGPVALGGNRGGSMTTGGMSGPAEGPVATPVGDLNCPVPEMKPNDPKAGSSVPLGWKTWMRWLPASATTMRPSGATATSVGEWNCPAPSPLEPKEKTTLPSGEKTLMLGRYEPLSIATILPTGVTAMLSLFCPAGKIVSCAPLGWYIWIRSM